MVKRMLIDDTQPEETRVVIVDGNKIEDVEFESTSRKQIKGNIYLAKVMRIEPSLQAAFVDYGGNRHGFLAFGEIHPDYYNISDEIVAEVDKEVDEFIEAKKQFLKDKEAERERIRAEKARRREERLKAMAEAEAKAMEEAAQKADALLQEHNEISAQELVSSSESEDLSPSGNFSSEASDVLAFDDVHLPNAETSEPSVSESVSAESVSTKTSRLRKSRFSKKRKNTEHDELQACESLTADEVENAEPLTEPVVGNVDEVQTETTADKPKKRFRRKKFSAPKEELKVLSSVSKGDESVSAEADRDSSDEAVVEEKNTSAPASESAKVSSEIVGENAPLSAEVISSGNDDEDDNVRNAAVQDDDDDDDLENDFELQRKLLKVRKLYHRSTIQDVIKEGQILLVQVVKEERGNKGAALTTYLSLAGRYCVLMPNRIKSGGVSRKITNAADRKRLKGIVRELPLTMDMSMIVRTAGEDKTKSDIVRDYNYLIRTWNNIRISALKTKAPALIHEEGNLIKRALRDMFSRDMTEVIVDGDSAYKTAREFIKILAPQNLRKIKINRKGDLPLFQRFQVEAQLDKLHDTNVQLESGGYLVINPTEALVSIDVNSGRATKEKDLEETALKTNLEAADEIARQLRMRDLAGLIVVDFIDMEDPKNNAAIEKRMKEAMKNDRSRVQIAKMSCFGLLEISRQRTHSSFFESNYKVCPFCHGKGLIRTIESSCVLILRSIEEEGIKSRSAALNVFVPADVAIYILNNKRDALIDLEKRYNMRIVISADNEMKSVEDYRVERVKGIKAIAKAEKPVMEEIIEEEDDDVDDGSSEVFDENIQNNGNTLDNADKACGEDMINSSEEADNRSDGERAEKFRRNNKGRRNRSNRFDRRRGRNRPHRNNDNGDNPEKSSSETVMLYDSHEDIKPAIEDNPEVEKKSTWWRKLIS